MDKSYKNLTVAGCGPGNPDYLTFLTVKAVQQAEAVVGMPSLLKLFPQAGPFYKLDSAIPSKVAFVLKEIPYRNIVLLVSGDPNFFSLGRSIRNYLGDEWKIKYLPGISSLQIACAEVGLSWQDMNIMSLHAKGTEEDIAKTVKQALRSSWAFLCGPEWGAAKLAGVLQKWMGSERSCWVVAEAGCSGQEIIAAKLGHFPDANIKGRIIMLLDKEQ